MIKFNNKSILIFTLLSLFNSMTMAEDYKCLSAKKDLKAIQKSQFDLDLKGKSYDQIRLNHDAKLAEIMLLRGLLSIKNEYRDLSINPAHNKSIKDMSSFIELKNDVTKGVQTIQKMIAVEYLLKNELSSKASDQVNPENNLKEKCLVKKLNSNKNELCTIINDVNDPETGKIIQGFFDTYSISTKNLSDEKKREKASEYLLLLIDAPESTSKSLQSVFEKMIEKQNHELNDQKAMQNKISQIDKAMKNLSKLNLKDKNLQVSVKKLNQHLSDLQSNAAQKYNLDELDLSSLNQVFLEESNEEQSKDAITNNNSSNAHAIQSKRSQLMNKFHNYIGSMGDKYFEEKDAIKSKVKDMVKASIKKGLCQDIGLEIETKLFNDFKNCLSKLSEKDIQKKIQTKKKELSSISLQVDQIRKSNPYKDLQKLKQYAAFLTQKFCSDSNLNNNTGFVQFKTCNDQKPNSLINSFSDDAGKLVAIIDFDLLGGKERTKAQRIDLLETCDQNISGDEDNSKETLTYNKNKSTRNLCGRLRSVYKKNKRIRNENKDDFKAREIHDDFYIGQDSYGKNYKKKKSNYWAAALPHLLGAVQEPFHEYSQYNKMKDYFDPYTNHLQGIKTAQAFRCNYYNCLNPWSFPPQSGLLYASNQSYQSPVYFGGDNYTGPEYTQNTFNTNAIEIKN